MALSQACVSLGRLLQQEQECSSRLLVILQTEHDAIARRDTDILQQAVTQKQALLAQLEASHGQRLQLISDVGLVSGRGGFETLIEQCADAGHDLRSRWSELKATLASCQQQNQLNGAVLESSRRTTHRALSILLGGQTDGPELYDQAGKSTPSTLGGNRVIKA